MSRRVRMLLGLSAIAFWLTAPVESGEPRPAALGSGRVVVVPVNLAVRAAPEVEPGLDPTWRELLAFFASEEQPAIALLRNDAGVLWNEVVAEEQKAGGEPAKLYAAYGRFARHVAEQVEFSGIVFPTLVTHSARVRGFTARWDGVSRPVEIPGQLFESIDTYREGKIFLRRDGATGELAAASLHVAVFTPRGELRYEGIGGLVLLQELAPPKRDDVELVTVMRKNPFDAPDQLREGIRAAFRE